MDKERFIDVEKLIGSKNPKALKWMPGFVVSYLKRILHQKEVNNFLIENKDKKNAEWCQACVDYMNITAEVKNLDKIPKEGKIVIAMNHPLGGMDAIVLVSALQGHREDLKFIVNDLLMNIESMTDMFVGVNKHGKNDVSLRDKISNLFESDNAICLFPAGLVSRKQKGNIEDLVWKKTFVTYAKKHGQTIVPIYIDGKLSNFFYRLSNFRKFIGIKANIEMLYLSNELFKQKNRKMKFVVGDPISHEELLEKSNDRKTAQEIKEIVYKLRND